MGRPPGGRCECGINNLLCALVDDLRVIRLEANANALLFWCFSFLLLPYGVLSFDPFNYSLHTHCVRI